MGRALRGAAVAPVSVGAPARAAVRPSARAGCTRPTAAGADAVRATVTSLEPQADLVRVRTDRLDALVPPAVVADLRLRVGDPIALEVPPDAVAVYPA